MGKKSEKREKRCSKGVRFRNQTQDGGNEDYRLCTRDAHSNSTPQSLLSSF